MTRAAAFARMLHGSVQGRRSQIRKRLGYRGLVLLMFGLIYMCIGLSVLGANDYRPELVHTHLPTLVRIALWAIPGIVSVIVAFDHKWQAIGFALLFLGPFERAISYAIAVVTVPTWTRVPATLIYLLLVLTITFMASWPEPPEVEEHVAAEIEGTLLRGDGGLFLDGGGEVADMNDPRGERDDLGRMTGSDHDHAGGRE